MYLRIFLILFKIILFANSVQAQRDVYLFSYFVDNGQDGLHFAYSHDGLKWEALKNEKSFLTPTVGKDKLMRDPCIIQGPTDYFTWFLLRAGTIGSLVMRRRRIWSIGLSKRLFR